MNNSPKIKSFVDDNVRLNTRLGQIPNEPGCYLMIDKEGRILYVGKSKSLRSRVRSYFRSNDELSPRIKLMVRQVTDIDFIVTDSESEALTLESNLIKKNLPYFNVLLKDDKKYPYLCITWSQAYPRVFITRRRRQRNCEDKYYGPFVDVTLLRKTLAIVKRAFPMRQRPIPLYKDRTCLNFQIGRCPGVCQEMVDPEQYRQTINKVAMVFQGRIDELVKELTKNMFYLSNREEYERAALIRDQIKGLEQLQQDQKMIVPDSSISRDIIAMSSNKKIAAIQIFQMRSGKLVGRLGYTSHFHLLDNSQLLQTIVEEHYSQVDPVEIPKEILMQYPPLDVKILSDWLSEIKGSSVKLTFPKRSKKADFIELVRRNAEYELESIKNGLEQQELALEDLASLLQLDSLPLRIEGFDISHIQGSDPVGSQVVFIKGLPGKQHYRKYRIKSKEVYLGHSNDYQSLKEVIGRRFKRWARIKKELGSINLMKTNKHSKLDTDFLNDWPDLLLIDGGKGQLNSVMEILSELDLDNELNVCSIAKKNEEVFVPGRSEPLESNHHQLALKLLCRVRDESHRFAINFHRQRRTARMKRSSLSEIPKIGPKRIKELLNHFQSIEAIHLATLDQLAATPSVGKEIALEVWRYFHPEDQENS